MGYIQMGISLALVPGLLCLYNLQEIVLTEVSSDATTDRRPNRYRVGR